MQVVLSVLLALVAGAVALQDAVIDIDNYTGFQVFRTEPRTETDVAQLRMMESRSFYDFWTEIAQGRNVDIMVPPKFVHQLEADLALVGMSYSLMIPDVQDLIKREKVPTNKEGSSADHPMTWDAYHPLEDMYAFFDYLEANYDFVSTEIIGQSGEGRDMRVLSVCRGGCGNKPAAWIDGGIHAREWISPAAVTWMLKELVENDADHPDLTENADWYFVASANPDGYAYSRDHSRMWRKTRSNHGSILACKGVDANRNWGYHWNEGGSSNDKCSDTYHGPEAWSEIENVNIRDYIAARKDKIVFYNSIHSYSQLILLPWGFTNTLPDDYEEMLELALKGSDALTAVHGKTYETGCIPCMLYIASGSSADWAHGEAGIKFTTSMELRDTGVYGFLLPPDQIIATAEETWAFHITVIRELIAMEK